MIETAFSTIRRLAALAGLAVALQPLGAAAQNDSAKAAGPEPRPVLDSVAAKAAAPAVIDSNDDNNFLERYYYGPDLEGDGEVYDPWDVYPDREGDSRERDNDDRDSQERDSREE